MSCKVPSDYPLLQDGTCVTSCEAGYFETVTGYCISCFQECLNCKDSTPTCYECLETDILIDGECYEGPTCPGDLILDDSNQCVHENGTECTSPCSKCGASNEFCVGCLVGYLELGTGECKTNCSSGSFGNNSTK